MGPVSPILLSEFFTALVKCTPPSGWPAHGKIAVANSGGPDSTCLLFLLAKLITHRETRSTIRQPLPTAVISLYVDHKLQAASSEMAAQAAANATAMGMQHRSLEIPWGEAPFPHKPLSSTAFERHAREARYHVLFHGMTQAGATAVAFGHHADDQVETSLMRLAKGSTEIGAAGMRRCRRWGMGSGSSEDGLGWVGHRGLDRFIVRPLLDFSKDRILATCEAHALDYVNDPTNFQPGVTLRNAVRQALDADSFHAGGPLPSDMVDSLEIVRKAATSLQSTVADVVGVRERLRRATSFLAERAEEIDNQVTKHLQSCSLPSPRGTILLSSSGLLEVQDPSVRFAIVLRVMRYVSFHPWGSIRADGDRRRAGIHRIMKHLWSHDPEPALLKKFTAGGGVLWTPVLYHRGKRLKTVHHAQHRGDGDFAWLASRIPPFFKNPQEGAGSASRLMVDLTEQFNMALSTPENNTSHAMVFEVLYDCRFLLRFDLRQMPKHVRTALNNAHAEQVSLKILPHTDYFWPRVVIQQKSSPDLVLAALNDRGMVHTTDSPPWISVEWVRLLDAT